MRKTALLSIVISITSIGISIPLSSCGPNKERLPLSSAINTTSDISTADSMLDRANGYASAGNNRKAISTYRDISKEYPQTNAAAEARYAEASLLDRDGDLLKAFEAYQDLIARYPGSKRYATAIKRQEDVAHSAANGIIKNNFLGMKTKIGPDKTSKMLADVRDNAPQAISAPRAQFAIGRVWQEAGNAEKAIAAFRRISIDYPDSESAPEALYQIGQILILKAEKGNHNKAHVNRAIDIFENLILRYPRHNRAADARERITMLNSQDIQRSYDTAEFYRNKGNAKSALFYYREVTRKTKSGSLHNLAKQRISELGG